MIGWLAGWAGMLCDHLAKLYLACASSASSAWTSSSAWMSCASCKLHRRMRD